MNGELVDLKSIVAEIKDKKHHGQHFSDQVVP